MRGRSCASGSGGGSGDPRATPRWRAQSATSAVASRSVGAAFSADPGADPGRLFLWPLGEATRRAPARAAPGKVLGLGFAALSASRVTLAACDLGPVALSPPQVVPGHRVRQRGRPHVPHAETEEASGGARQVGAGRGGGAALGGRSGGRGHARRSGGTRSSESRSPAPRSRPGLRGQGRLSAPPALSCFPEFSLFLVSSLGKHPAPFRASPGGLSGGGRC